MTTLLHFHHHRRRRLSNPMINNIKCLSKRDAFNRTHSLRRSQRVFSSGANPSYFRRFFPALFCSRLLHLLYLLFQKRSTGARTSARSCWRAGRESGAVLVSDQWRVRGRQLYFSAFPTETPETPPRFLFCFLRHQQTNLLLPQQACPSSSGPSSSHRVFPSLCQYPLASAN